MGLSLSLSHTEQQTAFAIQLSPYVLPAHQVDFTPIKGPKNNREC